MVLQKSKMLNTIILLLVSVCVYGQVEVSTTTIKITPKTTSQILLDNYVAPAVTNEVKLIAVTTLLTDSVYYKSLTGVDIDVKTGQDLTNTKTNIEKEIRNKELGRNYWAGVTYPIYKVKK